MARTISDIYLSIVNEKNNQPTLNALQPEIDSEQQLLSDVSSPSKVADWRLWAYIVSIAIWVHENLWDLFKSEIDVKISEAIPGTARWLRNQALLFQLGDILVWSNNKYQYALIDATKQIVKRCAVVDAGGILYIKVAKLVNNIPEKLSSAELSAFTAYMNKIKFAGTICYIISYDADLLKLNFTINYDPLVLKANGELINSETTIYPVEDAINNYIAGIEWNGTFNVTKCIDAIQAVVGVVDPILTSGEGKAYNGAYAAINQNYQSISGHMKIDDAFPLSATITYVPYV